MTTESNATSIHSLIGSMGHVGAAGDNAAMETFFALLHKNVLNTRRWTNRDQLRIAIITWIGSYHRRRQQRARGGLTPIEIETITRTTATQAAQQQLSPKPAAVPLADASFVMHRAEDEVIIEALRAYLDDFLITSMASDAHQVDADDF